MSKMGSMTTISAAAGGADAPRRRTCVNRLRLDALGGILRRIYSGRHSGRGMAGALQGGACRGPPPLFLMWDHVCCGKGGHSDHLQQSSEVSLIHPFLQARRPNAGAFPDAGWRDNNNFKHGNNNNNNELPAYTATRCRIYPHCRMVETSPPELG